MQFHIVILNTMDLIFVYNANSGKLNGILDIWHKIISPETYKCNLCNLTHGKFSEKKVWKVFRESTSLDLIFLHKDEFEEQFEERFSYPVILSNDGGLEIFISSNELNKISNPLELIELIKLKTSLENK